MRMPKSKIGLTVFHVGVGRVEPPVPSPATPPFLVVKEVIEDLSSSIEVLVIEPTAFIPLPAASNLL
jgi:hypothetical protein